MMQHADVHANYNFSTGRSAKTVSKADGSSQISINLKSLQSVIMNSSTFFIYIFFFCQARHCGAFIQKHSSIVTVFPFSSQMYKNES